MGVGLEKCPTGMAGIDEILSGGLPRGRTSLVTGVSGCGKTVFAMEFLVKGATAHGEPGAFLSFEEPAGALLDNFASFDWELDELVANDRVSLGHIRIDPLEIREIGDYELSGLKRIIETHVARVGAKRLVLDTMEVLLAAFSDQAQLRNRLKHLFEWIGELGVSAVVTAEQDIRSAPGLDLREYVADCALHLEHAFPEGVGQRLISVIKYRGSGHGGNKYPFVIEQAGFRVVPVTAVELEHDASSEIVPTGIRGLDDLLGPGGIYRGSSLLISGTAGTGKSNLAASMAEQACAAGKRCLYLAFEESPAQIERNTASVGMDFAGMRERGLLRVRAARPTMYGLERHMVVLREIIEEFDPAMVVMDPISNFDIQASQEEVRIFMLRFVDYLKGRGTTGVFTVLVHEEKEPMARAGVSSLMDVWLRLKVVVEEGERSRVLQIVKARGMDHSDQVCELLISDRGVHLLRDAEGTGTAMGAARLVKARRDEAERRARELRLERMRLQIESHRTALEAETAVIRARYEAQIQDLESRREKERIEDEAERNTRRQLRMRRELQPEGAARGEGEG